MNVWFHKSEGIDIMNNQHFAFLFVLQVKKSSC